MRVCGACMVGADTSARMTYCASDANADVWQCERGAVICIGNCEGARGYEGERLHVRSWAAELPVPAWDLLTLTAAIACARRLRAWTAASGCHHRRLVDERGLQVGARRWGAVNAGASAMRQEDCK